MKSEDGKPFSLSVKDTRNAPDDKELISISRDETLARNKVEPNNFVRLCAN